MNEADRKFTVRDKIRLKKFLGLNHNHKSTSEHADAFVRNLPLAESLYEPLHPFEDVAMLNSEDVLLERFFEEHFTDGPLEDYPEQHKRMHAGFHFWQDVVEQELFILNTSASLECSDLVRSLDLSDVYHFARKKEQKLKTERSRHLAGTHEFNFLSESCRRWTAYSNIAQGALHYEESLTKR